MSRAEHCQDTHSKRTVMRKIIIFAAAIAVLATAACNTVEGGGKDVKVAGAAVEDAAQDAK